MRHIRDHLQDILQLHRLKTEEERAATWRQTIASLAAALGDMRESVPLEGFDPNALRASARIALEQGLVDDMGWLSPAAASAALYELASALPAGSDEKRELGRRVWRRLREGDAGTFVALATQLAFGSRRALSGFARGSKTPHPFLYVRRLRTFLHVVDADGGYEDSTGNLRERRLRSIRALLDRTSADPPPQLRRAICATTARLCDALAREEILEISDVFIAAAMAFSSAQDLRAFAEASMVPEVANAVRAYAELADAIQHKQGAGRKIRPGCATAEYGAPEIWGMNGSDDALSPMASDVYAFGCLAFEAITGKTLFAGPNETALIAAHVNHDGSPPGLATLTHSRSTRDLRQFLSGALRRQPSDRASMTELRHTIQHSRPSWSALPWPLA